jgi:hypothetical protein
MEHLVEQLNQNLYLSPEQLTANEANEKARPAEKPEARAERVKLMASSIASNGQELPVLIVEKEDDGVVTYEYVDGGCRVEAVASLNETLATPLTVWCSLVDPTEDLFKKAVTANIHRTQNSNMDMAHIVQEAFDRNGWRGRGGGGKVAEYLGILPSRVSEYQKILHAPADIQAKINSGEIASLDAALKLMALPADKREEITAGAVRIAEEEQAERDTKRTSKRGGNPRPDVPLYKPGKHKPATVKAKHVAKAAKEAGVETATPRAKSEISEFFEAVSEAAYPKAAVAFAEYFVGTWMKGEGTDRHARALFDAAVGVKAPKAVIAVKPKAVKEAKVKKAPVPKKKK